MVKELITHVAILNNESIYSLPKPYRHSDIIKMMIMDFKICPPVSSRYSGFLINGIQYVNRIQAAKLALKTGQVEKLSAPPNLYSEDLW